MDIKRNELKHCLKEMDECSLRQLCKQAMLTETETDILAFCYSRRQDERYVADTLNMSVSVLQKKKRIALKKILYILGFSRKKYVFREEIGRYIDAFLF